MKKVIDKTYAKSKSYKKELEDIEKKGECPFCEKNFKYYKTKIIALKQYNGWFIAKSNWPYKNSLHHFMIVSKKHKEQFFELNKEDLETVKYLTNWAIKKFKIKGGALTIRFGDTKFTGATVCHLHFHLIYPQKNKKTGRAKVVNFPIG